MFCCSQKSVRMKLFVVGDDCVGKTCLLMAYVHNKFQQTGVPKIYHSGRVDTTVDEIPVTVGLWDTGGGVCLYFVLVV